MSRSDVIVRGAVVSEYEPVEQVYDIANVQCFPATTRIMSTRIMSRPFDVHGRSVAKFMEIFSHRSSGMGNDNKSSWLFCREFFII